MYGLIEGLTVRKNFSTHYLYQRTQVLPLNNIDNQTNHNRISKEFKLQNTDKHICNV